MPRVNGYFNGRGRRFECSAGVSAIDTADLYSDWKDWVRDGQGIGYAPMFDVIGGQELPGGLFAGRIFFLLNGWKIRPQLVSHRLIINGNLYSIDGSPVTIAVEGCTIEVSVSTSAQAQGIQVSGSSLTLAAIESSAILAKQSELEKLTGLLSLSGDRFSETALSAVNTDLIEANIGRLLEINGLISGVLVQGKDPSQGTPGFRRTLGGSNINQSYTQDSEGIFTLALQ